jgi:tRNA (cmo5U34)-methyltransferase
MSVAAHLGIKLAEYDARIRTFIPDYEAMLDVAAGSTPKRARTIVDLGVGTGALGYRCAQQARQAKIVGFDSDGEILKMAQQRLGSRGSLFCGSFLRTALPRCDAVVASFALHHVRTKRAKVELYSRIHAALRPRGLFITVDCHPALDSGLAREQRQAWRDHLYKSYNKPEAGKLLKSWSQEDAYTPLQVEIGLIQQAGFRVEELWRRGAFAVLQGKRG